MMSRIAQFDCSFDSMVMGSCNCSLVVRYPAAKESRDNRNMQIARMISNWCAFAKCLTCFAKGFTVLTNAAILDTVFIIWQQRNPQVLHG